MVYEFDLSADTIPNTLIRLRALLVLGLVAWSLPIALGVTVFH